MTAKEMRSEPECNFAVRFCNNETNHVLPRSIGGTAHEKPHASANLFVGLTKETWGIDAKWIVLKPPASYNYGGDTKKSTGKKKRR